MSSNDQGLVQLTLAGFADALAARTPTPGGGSLGAYLVASGAAVASMACRFTSGEKYAAVEREMAARCAELDRVRARALPLVQRDSDAYDAVTAAFRLPKATEVEKAARTAAVQSALKGALEVPLATMELALEGLRAAAACAGSINPNLASDCATGAIAMLAGLEAAWHNVGINAGSIQDAAYVSERLARAASMRSEAEALSRSVRDSLERYLAPRGS